MNLQWRLTLTLLALAIIPMLFIGILANASAKLALERSGAAATELDRAAASLVVVGGLSVFFLTLLVFGIAKSISKPILELKAVMDAMSKGNLDMEIDPRLKESKDEIGELARSFDRTIVSLKFMMAKSARARAELSRPEASSNPR